MRGGQLQKFLKFMKDVLLPAVELQLEIFRNKNPIIDAIIEAPEYGDTLELSSSEKRVYTQYKKFDATVKSTTKKLEEASVAPELYVLCVAFDTIDLKFKKAHENFIKYIDDEYDHVIYMSATFVNLDGFARDMGMEKSEYTTLQIPPFFKNEGGSFKFIPVRPNNAKITDKSLSQILLQMKDVVLSHSGEKGLIHCVNYKQKQIIVDVLEAFDINFITHDNAADKLEQLQEFMDFEGACVFVSPSSTEGLDLPDDLCRFIIFTKVPWLSLGDEWVKERMKDGDWYLRQALIATIQGAGRGLRHEQDYCSVYLLDSNFGRIIDVFPEWYLEQLENGK